MLVLGGLGLAIAVPVGWSLADHPTGVRPIHPGTAARLAAAPASRSARPARSAPARPSVAAARAGAAPTRATTSRPVAIARPVRIRIPTLAIDATVLTEGVDASGAVSIPADIHQLGWYRWGSAPGAAHGSTVIVGHVDSAVSGLGAFFTLGDIHAGAAIAVTTADGRVHRYRVVAREIFPKTSAPLAALFSQGGAPRLTLITCGGGFNRATHHYVDNVVVTAVPA